MLRVKRSHDLTSRSTFRTGVIVKTRAAFVGVRRRIRTRAALGPSCLARFEDGDEHELTLAEAVACAVDDPTHKVTHTSSLEADEDAETEPVGARRSTPSPRRRTSRTNVAKETKRFAYETRGERAPTRSRGASARAKPKRRRPRGPSRVETGGRRSALCRPTRRSEGPKVRYQSPRNRPERFLERRNVKRPTRAAPVRRASARGAGKAPTGRFAPVETIVSGWGARNADRAGTGAARAASARGSATPRTRPCWRCLARLRKTSERRTPARS